MSTFSPPPWRAWTRTSLMLCDLLGTRLAGAGKLAAVARHEQRELRVLVGDHAERRRARGGVPVVDAIAHLDDREAVHPLVGDVEVPALDAVVDGFGPQRLVGVAELDDARPDLRVQGADLAVGDEGLELVPAVVEDVG